MPGSFHGVLVRAETAEQARIHAKVDTYSPTKGLACALGGQIWRLGTVSTARDASKPILLIIERDITDEKRNASNIFECIWATTTPLDSASKARDGILDGAVQEQAVSTSRRRPDPFD